MIRIISQTGPFTPEEKERLKVKEMPPEEIPLADEEEIPAEETEAEIPPEEFPPGISPEDYEEIFPRIPAEEPLAPPEPPPVPEPKKPAEMEPEAEPKEEPPFPEDEYEEITEELTDLDRLNQTLSIPAKIDIALAEGYPLRIIYTTKKGHTTERTVLPDYYLPARTTGNWVLIAWCELRNGWRGFIVDRIRAAKLEQKRE